jgi:rubrerythrin
VTGIDRLRATLGAIDADALDRDGAIAETAEPLRRYERGELLGLVGGFTLLIGGLARPGAARAASREQDREILNYALSLEYLQASFYTEAERLNSLRGSFAEQARVVGAHERAHVEALQGLLGAAAIKRPRYDFQGVTESQPEFRETAVAFEDLAVAAYKEEAPRIQNRQHLAAAIRVHSVEARHAAWIRQLAGALPAPDAFDEPQSRKQVGRLVASTEFVVAKPNTRSSDRPRFTG